MQHTVSHRLNFSFLSERFLSGLSLQPVVKRTDPWLYVYYTAAAIGGALFLSFVIYNLYKIQKMRGYFFYREGIFPFDLTGSILVYELLF